MITYLGLKNFILVRNLEINLNSGLQILTGETGAGKSIIVGALHLIMGAQLKGEVAREKDKTVSLSASFSIEDKNKALMSLIAQYEIDISDNELFFSREIHPDGKSGSFLNGRKITNAIIKEFRDCLFDFHSQRDQQQLLNEDYQLLYLDHYAKLDQDKEDFSTIFTQYHDKIHELKKLREEEKKTEDRIKLYEYQIEEIDDLHLVVGEEEELDSEYLILTNAQEILDSNLNLKLNLYENENAIYDQVSQYSSVFEKYENDHPLISELSSNLKAIISHFDEIIHINRQIPQIINLDEARLEEINNRIQQIHQLKTKYKRNIEEILAYRDEMENYLKGHKSLQEEINRVKVSLEEISQLLIKKADRLSELRTSAAISFAKEIEDNLKQLSIPDANIKINVDKKEDLCNDKEEKIRKMRETGQDSVEYLFNANKGGHLQTLKLSASGGELSRLLLVVKKILSEQLSPQTIIFDEIDSGIGGKTADSLGMFIENISKSHQVICITHLAQVASYADCHYKIEKNSDKEKTEIEVTKLMLNEQIEEIARMLSGSLSETAIEHAKELLKKK